MFKYLKTMNIHLEQRYNTVINNLKTGTPTFYDALGNLIDNYLKALSRRENIELERGFSSGRILTNSGLKVFLEEKVLLPKHSFEALRNTIRFINEHSHENEKTLQLNNAVTSLESFFNVYIEIAKYYDSAITEVFDRNYYESIYKQNSSIMRELNKKVALLTEELKMEKHLTTTQSMKLASISVVPASEDVVEDSAINDMTVILNELKDIKIETLTKKLDEALDLLIEQKTSIRENRIISLSSLASLIGLESKYFLPIVEKAIEIIDKKGLDVHISEMRKKPKIE